MQRKSVQKHLGLFLDEKLLFLEYIDAKIKEATVGVSLMRKLNLLLPRSSLLTVYKCFIRPSGLWRCNLPSTESVFLSQ